MVRQYIGARYVPKFYENSLGTSEWQAGVIYEPLTIVTYNGNSYTSKKPVPAEIGNPSANPSYWVSTGNYSEQVEEYRQEVEEYKEQVENINEKKVVFISDSYCDSNRGGYTNGIFTTFCQRAGLVAGENAFLFYKGGAGFAGAGQGKTFGDLIDDAYGALSSIADEITDVFICGGANDVSEQQSDINTAKATALGNVETYFPKAITHLAVVSGFIPAADRKNLMNKVRYVYYANLPYKKCVAVVNSHLPMMIFNNYTDHVHPNASGCLMIGMCLASHLLTKDSFGDFGTVYTQACNMSGGTGVSATFYPRWTLSKDKFTVWLARGGEDLSLSESASVTHNAGVDLEVGQLASGANVAMLVPNAESVSDSDPVFRIPCSIMGYTGDNNITWIPIFGELLGVAGTGNSVTWHFKANTALKSATISSARWNPWKVDVMIR